MEKILVTSDSHGKIGKLQSIIETNRDVSMHFHLGDQVADGLRVARDLGTDIICVQGNCDFTNLAPYIAETKIGGKLILAVHGHMQNAKISTVRLRNLAKDKQADIVLYGHTHRPHFEYRGVYLVNPGAVIDGKYAILSIDGDQVNCELKKI